LQELLKLTGFKPSLGAVAHMEDSNHSLVLVLNLDGEEDPVDVLALPKEQNSNLLAGIHRFWGGNAPRRHRLQGVDGVNDPEKPL
jgi:hypothetical protein